MMIFCTLFDSNYIDKGLIMYRSLYKQTHDFRLYILAMDQQCETILESYHYPNIIVLSASVFIRENELERIKSERTVGEFCWSCTPFLIDYVLEKIHEEQCTYVDSDLFFYDDPRILLDEMGNKTVQIVEHRYNHSIVGWLAKKSSGTYCVQFNTFKNTEDSVKLLQWWKDQCYFSCSSQENTKKSVFGDQGYLENWGEKDHVSVLNNPGGGVAPWNICQYNLENNIDGRITLRDKKTKKVFPIVFYHFHNIHYYSRNKVYISVYEVWRTDRKLIETIYYPYLQAIDSVREELEKNFGWSPKIRTDQSKKDQTEKPHITKKISSLFRNGFFRGVLGWYYDKKNQQYISSKILEFTVSDANRRNR